MPPNTTTTKTMLPDRRRHPGLGHEGVAADHAGQPRQRAAAAEHQHEHARHVVAERLDHVGMRQRGLDDHADARARQHEVERDAASPTDTSIMNTR